MQTTQRIEGYDSLEQISSDGSSVHYKARQVSHDRTVTIKVFSSHLTKNRGFVERFRREANGAARIQHENVVNVIDYGEVDGSYYLVTEYCDAVTLHDLLREQAMIPVDVCLTILLNVCYGLEALHSVNLVHGAITPASIVCTRQGQVKIAGFGVAETSDQKKRNSRKGRGGTTPAYTSPEQTKGDPAGPQSDIFSLGAVAYEVIGGKHPFDGRTHGNVIEEIRNRQPSPVSDENPLVERSLSSILARMLQKNLSERYQHVSEVVMDFEEAIDKQKYRRDQKLIGEYVQDPASYLETFKFDYLESLMSKSPPAKGGDNAARIVHYRKILHLNPEDAAARRDLERLRKGDSGEGDSPDAASNKGKSAAESVAPGGAAGCERGQEYRVILESIDRDKETHETFALKLAMTIRSPVPRVTFLVKNMPAAVGKRLTYKRAKRLAGLMEELGGRVRIETHTDKQEDSQGDASRPSETRAKQQPRKTAPPSASAGPKGPRTEPRRPAPEESSGQKPSIQLCPECGWEGDVGAKFCPTCWFTFDKSSELNPASLRSVPVFDNPLADPDRDSVSTTKEFLAGTVLGVYLKPILLVLLVCVVLAIVSRL